jgi:DNA-directed RNA polymerase specialized sigma24 family protein
MADHSFTPADHAAVASATKILYSRYRNYVEYADVQQELYLWLLDHYDRAIRWRANLSERHAERTVVKALRNAGERYCRTEKAERDGYAVEDEFFYSIPMIADLLSLSYDPLWSTPKGIDYAEQKPVSPSNELIVMVADVTRAAETLPEADQALLRYVYGGKRTPKEAYIDKSLEWGISETAAYNRIRRVVGRVRAALGGENPWREIA